MKAARILGARVPEVVICGSLRLRSFGGLKLPSASIALFVQVRTLAQSVLLGLALVWLGLGGRSKAQPQQAAAVSSEWKRRCARVGSTVLHSSTTPSSSPERLGMLPITIMSTTNKTNHVNSARPIL